MRRIAILSAAMLLAGCAATAKNVDTVVLPTSNKKIDVVQHRSDVKFADCGTLVVLQTYSSEGSLIDSKEARGQALHCDVIVTGIEAGATIGAANMIRKGLSSSGSETNISNANEQSQGQGQEQLQVQSQESTNINVNSNVNTSSSKSGSKSISKPLKPVLQKKKGNNGYGNGGKDGSPNGKQDKDR